MEVSVRSARSDDYTAYARLHHELGTPDGPMAPELWSGVLDRTLVVEDDGQVVAYGLWMLYGPAAHVMNVVVDPNRRAGGLGGRVMAGIAARVREAGATEWFLNVKETNTPAIRLYERWGLRSHLRSHAFGIRWAHVERLAPAVARVRPLQPHEDGAVETQFDLTPGLLAGRRSSPLGYSVLVVEEHGAIVGLAASSPSKPGAYPFRVMRPELAQPLLESLRPLVPEGAEPFTITAEGDEALASLLRKAGAHLHFSMQRMKGAVP